ncbi:hypothetical protein [Rhodopseudomonas palustris]|uniref:hypothetical protein n=1 Tax=Rhodopseudomonas palustris TaxID=1076 RepID=UPI000641BB8A|nr:hypothetical protein [Rhodopseudomonas palustris]
MSFAPLAAISPGRARRGPRIAALTLLLAVGSAGGTWAETPLPDSENGRYTFTPSADGVVRLDTRTGKVSTCTDKGSGWACYAIADERAAFDAETGRLQAEIDRLKQEAGALRAANDSLKAQLASAGQPGIKTEEAMPKSDRLPQPQVTEKDGQRKLEIPLPSDQDVDRVMGFLERAWRKLIDMATRVQRDISGDKI